MANSRTSGSSKPAGKGGTEADANSIDGQAGERSSKGNRSGKDAASHTKAGTGKGAGGGKKRERQH
jgi:hypothetical protein